MSVKIRRCGNVLAISPLVIKNTLLESMTWYRRERNPESRWNKKVQYYIEKPEPLYRENADTNEIITFAGLLPRILHELQQAKLGFEIEDVQSNALPAPDKSKIGYLRPKQQEALDAIFNSPCGGQVICPTAFGKTHMIMLLCQVYGDIPIIVTSPSIPTVRALYKRIAGVLSDVGLVDGQHRKLGRVTVASAQSLMKCDLENCRLMLFDEVHKAAGPKISSSLTGAQRARMFGFTASEEGRTDQGERMIEALFGPAICRIPYEDAAEAGTVVPLVVVAMNTLGPSMGGADPNKKTREGIWRNKDRNEALAMVSRQLTSLGQVLIMVKTLEHGLFLRELLEDWPLVYASEPSTELPKFKEVTRADEIAAQHAKYLISKMDDLGVEHLTNARRGQLADQFAEGVIKGAIATGTWGTGVDFPGLQFIVRASGQGSIIETTQESGRTARLCADKKVGIVIDCEDEFDMSLVRRRNTRFQECRKHKWQLIRHVEPGDVLKTCQQILLNSSTE